MYVCMCVYIYIYIYIYTHIHTESSPVQSSPTLALPCFFGLYIYIYIYIYIDQKNMVKPRTSQNKKDKIFALKLLLCIVFVLVDTRISSSYHVNFLFSFCHF